MRQQVHAFIDQETYLLLKAQNINISAMIRNALTAAVDSEITQEESELQSMINKNKEELQKLNKTLSENVMKLAILRERKEQETQKIMKEMPAYKKTIQESGVLNWDM